MVVSLPTSRFGLSVAQFGLLGIWLIGGNLKEKFSAFFRSKAAIVLVSLYLLHVAGLIYTSDINYALKDLRIKLPLLFLPVLFVSVDFLSIRTIRAILYVYIGAVIASTLYSLSINLFNNVSDFREISPLISHIRLSLNICLALFFSLFFMHQQWKKKSTRAVFFGMAVVWLFLSLIMIESVTGIFIVIFTLVLIALFLLFHEKNWQIRWTAGILSILTLGLIFVFIHQSIHDYFTPHTQNFKTLEKYTSRGNPYFHDTVSKKIENGRYIYLYLSLNELRQAWNEKSDLDFDGQDMKQQNLKSTLIRYMNSKGLRKDAEGFSKLTDKDIKNVEMGIANVEYAKKFSLRSRLYKLFWEYQAYESGLNPEGLSMLQRVEYWKTSVLIISDHFWTGVGTGDLNTAFNKKYNEINSRLSPEVRYRSHNQFLAIFVGFGVFGFLLFLFTLIYPGLQLHKFSNYFYFTFWLTLIISMLAEDTLETQMGVTLFAFFNSFLLFQPLKKTPDISENS